MSEAARLAECAFLASGDIADHASGSIQVELLGLTGKERGAVRGPRKGCGGFGGISRFSSSYLTLSTSVCCGLKRCRSFPLGMANTCDNDAGVVLSSSRSFLLKMVVPI